jgi:hypothetical protein
MFSKARTGKTDTTVILRPMGRLRGPAMPPAGYLARRAHLVFFSIFLCLCLRIFLRRFLMTEPKWWIS